MSQRGVCTEAPAPYADAVLVAEDSRDQTVIEAPEVERNHAHPVRLVDREPRIVRSVEVDVGELCESIECVLSQLSFVCGDVVQSDLAECPRCARHGDRADHIGAAGVDEDASACGVDHLSQLMDGGTTPVTLDAPETASSATRPAWAVRHR